MAGALEGIRIIEIASFVSGPYAGMLLGDLGAEIIKIEAPDKGDPFRGWGRVEYSPPFGSVNRNKKSVTLDLKSPDGLAAVRKLLRTADVLIENFRPGTLDRVGLTYEQASKDNPKLIWCSITGFGSDGPYASRPGYDTVGQAMSGLPESCHRYGRPSANRHFIVRPPFRHGGLQRRARRAGRARAHRQRSARRYLAPGSKPVLLRRECGALFRERQGPGP